MNSPDNNKGDRILVAACVVIIVFVLGFLLWGMGNGCARGICGPDHLIANMYVIPAGVWTGFSPGTCGSDTIPMNYSTPIIPNFTLSLLHVYGESEPDKNLTWRPRLHRYEERREIINTLMDRAHMSYSPDSVIGLYEFPDARLLLIDSNPTVTEILQTGDDITVFTRIPMNIGSRQYTYNETLNPRHGNYNYSYTNSLSVGKLYPVFPPDNPSLPLYIVKKVDSERDTYPDGRLLDEITTRGTFYVAYGTRVERVIGNVSVTLDPEWKTCSPRLEISGEGNGIGEIKSTVKLARSSDRMLRVRLIATGAYIQQYDVDMSSSDSWRSTDSTGCSC